MGHLTVGAFPSGLTHGADRYLSPINCWLLYVLSTTSFPVAELRDGAQKTEPGQHRQVALHDHLVAQEHVQRVTARGKKRANLFWSSETNGDVGLGDRSEARGHAPLGELHVGGESPVTSGEEDRGVEGPGNPKRVDSRELALERWYEPASQGQAFEHGERRRRRQGIGHAISQAGRELGNRRPKKNHWNQYRPWHESSSAPHEVTERSSRCNAL